MNLYFITLLFISLFIVPASFDRYDVILVTFNTSNYDALNLPKRYQKAPPQTKQDYIRLNIEEYEDPIEILNLDDQYLVQEQVAVKRSQDVKKLRSFGDDKIVGGDEVEINLYPYHASYGINCAGAIISEKWIITAAHCGSRPYIGAGSKFQKQGRGISVKQSIVHPMWTASVKEHPFDYDFQLLELAVPLVFDDNIQPIKIAHIGDMVVGKVVTVTGWGFTKENGQYSSVLRAVRVPIISKENCQNVPFPYFRGTLTPRMFCAGFSDGKKDACQGDSGGPAVAHDRLLGLVSFGYGCATPGSYGVYSKVAKVRDWIEDVTDLKLS